MRGLDRHQCNPFITIGYKSVARDLLRDRLFNCMNKAFAKTGQSNGVNLFRTTGNKALFLSRIKSVPCILRGHLLQILRRGCIHPMNDRRNIPVSIQIVTTAGGGLPRRIRGKGFQLSLCCHLSILPVRIPPLHGHGKSVRRVSRSLLQVLSLHCRGSRAFSSHI